MSTTQQQATPPTWQPDWKAMPLVGTFPDVAAAQARYYKPERLNRDPEKPARMAASDEAVITANGFACIASHHDSVTGQGLWARYEDGALAVYASQK